MIPPPPPPPPSSQGQGRLRTRKLPVQTRIYRPTPANLRRLASALARGDLVAVPSETVYGLAADALNVAACEAIFAAKRRPHHDPLIVHIASLRQLHEIAMPSPEALLLAKAFWPGPLTLVLPKRPHVPDLVTAGLPSVAVRMPAHPLFQKIIRLSQRALAAPSANPFGYVSPTTAQHVKDNLQNRIKHILDGGPCKVGVESTIIDLREPLHPVLLRAGGLPVEEIQRVLQRPVSLAHHVPPPPPPPLSLRSHATQGQTAPGMLDHHYSPRTPVALLTNLTPDFIKNLPPDEALLCLQPPKNLRHRMIHNLFYLSKTGDLNEAARQLFDRLRMLDNGGWKKIHAELPGQKKGLAPAIRDRLTRAAAKR
ncbi:threonylcarbamoyl-AMP synthase [Opitutaceae bacterium TAV4]|nr:threonylcarbamoyl-AMP synthase [Opitutaceae bacterium TAV4]